MRLCCTSYSDQLSEVSRRVTTLLETFKEATLLQYSSPTFQNSLHPKHDVSVTTVERYTLFLFQKLCESYGLTENIYLCSIGRKKVIVGHDIAEVMNSHCLYQRPVGIQHTFEKQSRQFLPAIQAIVLQTARPPVLVRGQRLVNNEKLKMAIRLCRIPRL